MNFKKFLSFTIALTTIFLFSCEKTTFDTLIGEWDTSDGGKINFVADGTGTATGSDFFEVDFGNGPITDFTWQLSETVDSTGADIELLSMDFVSDSANFVSFELPLEKRSKNEVYVGIEEFDLNVTLTR